VVKPTRKSGLQGETFERARGLYRIRMRANLPHALRERRPSRRGQRRPGKTGGPAPAGASGPSDVAVERVREAGGPVDHASYSCQCGYVFLAPVSTTVSCPHCETGQVW